MASRPLPALLPTQGKITHNAISNKTFYTTTNPIEARFGYHRAVRRGNMIWVSGTTALKLASERSATSAEGDTGGKDGEEGAGKGEGDHEHVAGQEDNQERLEERLDRESTVHHRRDARLQAIVAMERCVEAVRRLGGTLTDVVRVKMFVARHEDCGAVGDAYRQCFAEDAENEDNGIGAAATMIVVRDGFVEPDMLVEVEVDAMLLD